MNDRARVALIAAAAALALGGCQSCGGVDAAADPPVEPVAVRAWPAPQWDGELGDPADAVLAAGGGWVVFPATAAGASQAEAVLAYDVARNITGPVFTPEIDGAGIFGLWVHGSGVSDDGRYVALLCLTGHEDDPGSIAHRVCVRDRVAGTAHAMSAAGAPISISTVSLSGDGSTVVVRSVGPSTGAATRPVRILRGPRDGTELREIAMRADPIGVATPSLSVLGLSHDGGSLLYGVLLDPEADEPPMTIHVVRDGPPQRMAQDLEVMSARFASRDGSSVELVLRTPDDGFERRTIDVASGALGPATPTSDELPLSGPVESVGGRYRAELSDDALHVRERSGATRSLPLPAGARDVVLTSVSEDGHVLASATIGERPCLALLAPEPRVIGCGGL